MSDDEREALEKAVRGSAMTPYDDGDGGTLWRTATASERVDVLAPVIDRLFAARIREACITVTRDHVIPPRSHGWSYRNGYWDGANNAAAVIRASADEPAPIGTTR